MTLTKTEEDKEVIDILVKVKFFKIDDGKTRVKFIRK